MDNYEIDVNKIITNLVEDSTKKLIETIKSETKEKANTFFNKLSINYKFAFKEYLTKAYKKYSKIKTLLYKTEPKYLYDFFECNDLKYENHYINPIDVNNVLKISHFLIIKGTGGIGKSTLMKHLFIDELKKQDLIPIFFELKDLNNFNGDLETCIYNSISNLGCEFEKKYFEYAMKSGRFLFLLDGYDEISNAKLEKFHKDLEKICDKFDKNYYIMSSRPGENFIAFQRFTILSTCDFSKEKAINLITKIEYDTETKERFIKELDTKLYNSHRSFASNPLLLTIMLLTYNDYAEIPNKLYTFYAQAFETLYTKHDATKSGYKREMKSGLSKDTFMKIFSAFCFFSYMKEMIEFTDIELEEIFNNIKKEELQFNNDKFLEDLVSSICLMYKDGKNYRFTHRSFQEYFTARYILGLSDELQKKVCKVLIEKRQYDNVLGMLYDMSRTRFEKNVLIPYLEEKEKKCEGDRYEYYFKILYREVFFKECQDGSIGLSLVIGNKFIFDIVKNREKRMINKKREFTNKKYIIDKIRKNERKVLILKSEEVFQDEKIKEDIKKQFCDYSVRKLMNLYNELKSSYDTMQQELENLLKL